MLYKNKIRQLGEKLINLTNEYITFSEYTDNLINEITEVTNCLISEKCDKKFCLMGTGDKYCKLVVPKTNLINGNNNETVYFIKLADELLRYNRIKLFMFEPKSYLSISELKYNLNDNEIVLLQSLLSQDYFEDLVPEVRNKYIKYNTYDNANPAYTRLETVVKVAKEQEEEVRPIAEETVAEERKEEIVISDCNTETKAVFGKLKNIFPRETREIVFTADPASCTFNVIKTILSDYTKQSFSINKLKEELISEYKKDNEYLFDILEILSKQKGISEMKRIISQIKLHQATLEQVIMSENYYASNLDIWVLAVKYNVPLIFLSGTKLIENDNDILVANKNGTNKYYFVKSPGISIDKFPEYRLFTLNNESTIDIDVFDEEFKLRLLDRSNYIELEDFIKEFSRKKKRQPIKTKKQFLILEEGEEKPKPKPKKKIVLIE